MDYKIEYTIDNVTVSVVVSAESVKEASEIVQKQLFGVTWLDISVLGEWTDVTNKTVG